MAWIFMKYHLNIKWLNTVSKEEFIHDYNTPLTSPHKWRGGILFNLPISLNVELLFPLIMA